MEVNRRARFTEGNVQIELSFQVECDSFDEMLLINALLEEALEENLL